MLSVGISLGTYVAPNTTVIPAGAFVFRRPDGTSLYLRTQSIYDTYLRP